MSPLPACLWGSVAGKHLLFALSPRVGRTVRKWRPQQPQASLSLTIYYLHICEMGTGTYSMTPVRFVEG